MSDSEQNSMQTVRRDKANRYSQRIIGITGGVGMGKTTVSNYLAEVYQLPVLDADLYARDAVEPGSKVLRQIVERYGTSVLLPEGRLNRARLGEIVFSSLPERLWLEQQIHPYVRDRMQAELRNLSPGRYPIVVLVVPLLFEARMTDLVTEIWVVRSLADQQVDRLKHRDRLNLEQIQSRINSQMAISKKTERADVILDNSSTLAALFRQVDAVLNVPEAVPLRPCASKE
jgi:dephospho-CoA kinase